MNITKKQSSKRRILLAFIAALVLLTGVAAYIYLSRDSSDADQKTTQTEPQRSESDHQQAKELAEEPQNKERVPNTDTAPPAAVDEVSGKNTVQMVVAADTADNTLYIRGGTNTPVSNNGACYAQLTGPSGQSIRKDTTLLQNASTTDCNTISISKSDLASGAWSIRLYYTSDNTEGASSEVTVEI